MPPLTGVFVVCTLIYMHANLAKKLTLKKKIKKKGPLLVEGGV